MYSHNNEQIFNTGIVNAGISGGGMASFETGGYDSNGGFFLAGSNAELEED
jgi:hypothetical protein